MTCYELESAYYITEILIVDLCMHLLMFVFVERMIDWLCVECKKEVTECGWKLWLISAGCPYNYLFKGAISH